MVFGNELGDERNASRMPLPVVQGAQYMNDAVGSVFGKFSQTRNNQKSTEFSGGIWDYTPVEEKVASEPSCVAASNNFANKIFSLDEMLACYEKENDEEMRDSNDLLPTANKPSELSADSSDTEMFVDVKNKRWRSEEFDKTSPMSNDIEVNRKKPKKNVSFSDVVVNLEDLPRLASSNNSSNCVSLDEPLMEVDANDIVEVVFVKENKHKKDLNAMAPNNVHNMSDKGGGIGSALEKKSKGSFNKVENWLKLQQSSENKLSRQQFNDKKKSEIAPSKKSSSKERLKSLESNDCFIEHEITKTSVVAHKVNNEESINRSHLENTIPELFEESKPKNQVDHRLKKRVKDESHTNQGSDELSIIRNIVQQIKQTSKKNSPKQDTIPSKENDLSNNNKSVSNKQEDKVLKQKENEAHLENVLLKIFNDSDVAKNIKTQVVKLAEQKNKLTVKDKVSNDKQLKVASKLGDTKSGLERKDQVTDNLKMSVDESQYKSKSFNFRKEKVCCPPVCEKPSCKQAVFDRNEKIEVIQLSPEKNRNAPLCEKPSCKQAIFDRDVEVIELSPEKNKNTLGKISPTLYQKEKNSRILGSGLRSDLCSNWRSQCQDVRQKDKGSYQDSEFKYGKTSRGNNHDFRKTQQGLQNVEYVDEPLVVIPLNLSQPPEPSTRFKNVNSDPESIWEQAEEKFIPSVKNKQIQFQRDRSELKDELKSEEIHAQLIGKSKTSIPIFFPSPTKGLHSNGKFYSEISENREESAKKKTDSALPVKLRENSISSVRPRSFERSRPSSANWRNPSFATPFEPDVYFIVKIKSREDDTVEKLKILKEDFLEIKKDKSKLSELIPYPGYQPRSIAYSACAVKIFIRCIFSKSYQIPDWMTALEAFSLGKKYRVHDLMEQCEKILKNCEIPPEEICQVACYAQQLHSIEALKFSKHYQAIQKVESFSVQNRNTPKSCSVWCSVLIPTSEFNLPLLSEVIGGLQSCNESDIKNSVFLRSLSGVMQISGIQLKFLTEDVNSCSDLHIVCEVFEGSNKLFSDEFDTKAKPSIKIPFSEEIDVKLSQKIEISVVIDDCLLKMCPQLLVNKYVCPGKFHATFESSKANTNRLFCIEKIFYTSQS